MWHRVVPSGGLRGRPEPPGRTRFLRFLFLNLPLACLGLSERTTASKEDGDFDWRDPEPAFLHETALNKYGPKPVQFYAVHDASASVQSGYSQPRIPAEDAEYVDGDRPDDRRKNGQVVNEGGFPIKNSVAETRKSPHHDHVAISTKMGRVTTPRGDSSSSMATVLADDVVLTTDKAASLTAALTNTGVFGDGDAGDGIIADSTVSHAQASTSGTATLKLLTANDQDQRGSTDIDTLRAQHAQLQEDDVTNAQNLARVRKSAAERTAQARLLDSMTKVRNIAGRVRERATAVLNRYGVGLNATATASTGGSFDSIFDNYFDNWDQANSYPTYKWPQTSPQTAGTVVVAQVSISMNATCKDVLDAVKTAVARDYGTVLADHVMRGAGCSAAGATEIERSAKVGMQLSSGQDANTVAKNPSFVQAMKQSFASTMGVALSKVSNVLITVVTSSAATLFLEGNLVQTSDGKSERTTTTTVQFLVKATVSVDTAAEAAAAIAAWPVESTPATLASHVTAQVTASSALTAVVISVTSAVSVPAQSIGVIEEPLSGTALPAPATTTTTTTSSTTFDPAATTVAPVAMTVAPAATTVAPAVTTVAPVAATVAPASTTVAPAATAVAPAATTVAPAATTVAPAATTVASAATTVAPAATTTVAPAATTLAPAATTLAPAATTVAPAATMTVAPAATTLAPAATTLAPAGTTVAPAATTVAPAATTVAPASTTAAPAATISLSLASGFEAERGQSQHSKNLRRGAALIEGKGKKEEGTGRRDVIFHLPHSEEAKFSAADLEKLLGSLKLHRDGLLGEVFLIKTGECDQSASTSTASRREQRQAFVDVYERNDDPVESDRRRARTRSPNRGSPATPTMLKVMDEIAESGGHSMSKQLDSKDEEVFMTAKDANSLIMEESDLNLSSQHARTTRKRDNPVLGDVQAAVNRAGVGGAPGDGVQELGSATDIQNTIEEAIHEVAHMTLAPTTTTTSSTSTSTSTTSTTSYTSTRTTTLTTTMQPTTTTEEPESENERLAEQNALANAIGQVENAEGTLERELEQAKAEQQQLQRSSGHESSILAPVSRGLMSSATHTTTLAENLLKAAKEATQDEGEKQEDTSSFFSAASTFSTSTSDESAASHKEDEHQRMLTTSSTRRRSSTSALLDEDGLELSASTGAEQRHQPLKKSDSFGASRTALVDSLESPSRGSFSSFVAGAFSFLQIGPGGLFSRRNGGHFEDVAASRASSHGGSLGEQLNRQGSSKPKNLDSAVGAGLWDGGDRRGTPGSGSPDREHLPEGRGAALQRENFVDAREYEGDNQPNDVDDQRSYYDQNPRGHQTVYGAHRATPNKARRRRDSAPHAPPTADSRRRHARRHRHDRGDVDFIHGPVMRSRAPPGDFEDGIANTGSSEPSPRWTYGDSHRDSRGYHSRTEDEDHSYRYPDHVVSSSDVDHASQYHGDARRDNEYYDVPPDTRDSHWSGMLPSNLHLRDDAGYRTPVRKTGGHRMFDSGHLNDDESVFEYLPLPNEQLLDPSGFPISSSLYGRGNTYTEDIMLEDHARDRERGASVLAPPPASNVEEDLEKNDYDFDELDGIGGASSTSSTYGRWRHQGDQGGADRFFDDEDLDRSEDFEQKQDEDSKARLSSRNPASEEDRPSDDREALRTNAASGSFIHQQSEDGPEAQSRGRKPQDRSGHSTNEAHEADSMHVSSALGTRTSNERTENQRNPPPSARVMRLELDATALSALADDCLTRLSSQSSSKEKDHDSTKGRHHALTGPHSKIKDAEAGSTLSPSTQAHTSSSTQQKPGSLQHSPTAPHPSPTSFFGATVGEASTTQENDNFHGLSRDSFVAQLEREKRQIEAVATAVTNARRASVGHSYILPPVSFIETGSSITVSPAKEDEDPHAGEKLSSHRADKRTVVDDSVQVASALTGVASAPRGPLVREEENHRTGTPPASTVHMHTHDDRQSVPSRQPLVRRESSQTVKGSGWNDQQGVNFYNKDAHLQNLGGTSPGRLEDDYRYDSRLVEVEQRGNYLGEWPGADPAMSNFERSHLQHGDIVDGAGREGDFEEQPFASLRSRSDVTDAEEEVVSRAPQSSVSQEVVAHEVYHRGADDLDHQQDHRRGVRGEGPRERLSMLPRHGRQTRLITAQNPARASSLQRTSAAQMGSSHDSERQSASVSIGRNSDNLPRVDRGGVYADLSSSAETYQGSSIGTGNYPYGSYTPYGAQQPGMQQPMPPAPYWNPYYGQQPVLGPGATAQAPYGYGYPGYNAPPVAGGANSAGYGFYPPTPGTPQQAGGPYGYPPGGASQIVPGVAATGGGGYQESGYGYGTSVGATPGVYDPASAVTDFAAAINPLIPPGASGGTAGGESFASRYLSSLVLVFLLMAMCYGCYHYAEHLRNESPEGGQHHSSRGNQGTSGSFRDPGREQRGGGSARAGTMGEGNIRHYPTLGGTPAGSGPPMSTGNRFPAQQQQQFQPGYGEQGFQQHSQIPAGGTSSAAAPAMNIMVRSSVSPQAPRPHQLLQEDQMQTSEKQRVGQEQVPAPTHETLNARRDVPVIRMSPSASQGVSPTKVHNATTPTHDDRSYKTTPKSSSENAALSD